MIYKVFYQETKDRNPRRETTHALYLDIDAPNEREGRIQARQLVEQTQISISNLSHHFLSNTLLMRKSQVPLN